MSADEEGSGEVLGVRDHLGQLGGVRPQRGVRVHEVQRDLVVGGVGDAGGVQGRGAAVGRGDDDLEVVFEVQVGVGELGLGGVSWGR